MKPSLSPYGSGLTGRKRITNSGASFNRDPYDPLIAAFILLEELNRPSNHRARDKHLEPFV